jgi:hypothetical protein
VVKKRKKSLAKGQTKRTEMNPNEPPSSTIEEQPPAKTGIRTMKDMFRIIKNE